MKAILFDFNGTITLPCDWKQLIISVGDYFYQQSHQYYPVNYDLFISYWLSLARKNLSSTEVTQQNPYLTKIDMLYKSFGITLNESLLYETSEKSLYIWKNFIKFPHNIQKILGILQKNHKLGIISNFDHPDNFRNFLTKINLIQYFECIVLSGDIIYYKPHKTIFTTALKQLDVTPEDTIFVGDRIDEDIVGAARVGCVPILIDPTNKYPNYLGKKIICLDELIHLSI